MLVEGPGDTVICSHYCVSVGPRDKGYGVKSLSSLSDHQKRYCVRCHGYVDELGYLSAGKMLLDKKYHSSHTFRRPYACGGGLVMMCS